LQFARLDSPRILVDFHRRIGSPLIFRRSAGELTLSNGSRVVCLPCKDETIRGFAGVALLIIDEAAQVPDDIYRTVRPMLAVSNGRLICLSTPFGKRGFFWDAWNHGGDDWARSPPSISRPTPHAGPRQTSPCSSPSSSPAATNRTRSSC
jgi:hypothetical protein